jgi:ribosomal protein S18 acetylase RimI-like enzyme
MVRRDVPAVCRVVRAAYEFLADQQGYSLKQRRRLIEERCSPEWIGSQFLRWRSFVALSGRRVVGALAVNGAEIEELFVRPEDHRHGLGTRLFCKAEQVIVEDGHKRLQVRTTGYAVPFYKAMGAKVMGEERVTCGPLIG